MEKPKPSKKKAYYKNRNSDGESPVGNNCVAWQNIGKKDFGKVAQRGIYSDRDTKQQEKCFSKRPLQQPQSRLADLDQIWQKSSVGSDFEVLANAPVSTAHFTFKSEKSWTLDPVTNDDYFTFDTKNLAAVMECIPFNKLIELSDKYFTEDELTYINSSAEEAKKDHYKKLESMRKEEPEIKLESNGSLESNEIDSATEKHQSMESERLTDKKNLDSETIEEDLDFLLSLKEPVRPQPVSMSFTGTIKSSDEIKPKNVPGSMKSMDLETWLDLVLDA